MEEFSNLRARHLMEEQAMSNTQHTDYISEKERIQATRNSIKIMEIQYENTFELRKLQASHINQIRQLTRAQKARKAKRFRHWSQILGRDLTVQKKIGSGVHSGVASGDASGAASGGQSGIGSNSLTRQSSDPNLKQTQKKIQLVGHDEDEDDEVANMTLTDQSKNAKDQLQRMEEQLKALASKHHENLEKLQAKQMAEFKSKDEEFQQALTELEWQQDVELKDLIKAGQAEIDESLAIQERELEMEGFIRSAETKALQERRVLNSLLDTVVDGVISIDVRGFIMRFK